MMKILSYAHEMLINTLTSQPSLFLRFETQNNLLYPYTEINLRYH